MNEWTWEDGWILMSVYFVQSTDNQELCDVIVAADVINHAIPAPDELSSSFSKLSNADIIKIEGNKYIINPDFYKKIKAVYNKKGGLFESPQKGEDWLKKSNFNIDANLSITIPAEDYKEAIDKYNSIIKQRGY